MTEAESKARADLFKYYQADSCPLQRGSHAGFKMSTARSNCEKAFNTFRALCVASDSYRKACYDPKKPAICHGAGRAVPRCSFQCRTSPTGAYKTKQLKDIVSALHLLS